MSVELLEQSPELDKFELIDQAGATALEGFGVELSDSLGEAGLAETFASTVAPADNFASSL